MKTWAIAIFVIVIIATILHASSPNVPDPDSLYHFRHASLYQESLLQTTFPWIYHTAIRTEAADLWYGFHFLLLPFTYVSHAYAGIKIAGIFLTSILLVSTAWTLRRHQISCWYAWPFFMLLAVPNALFQFLMVRPHMVTLTLLLPFVSTLIIGTWWQALMFGVGLSFFHISLIWMPLVMLCVVGGVASLQRIFNWRLYGGALAGLLLGLVMRPNIVGTLKLFYIQIVELFWVKQSGLPLLFGKELSPLHIVAFWKSATAFFLVWILSVIIFAWIYRNNTFKHMRQSNKLFLVSTGLLSLIFGLMTIFIARRSMIFWVVLGTLFIAALTSRVGEARRQKDVVLGVAILVFLFTASFTIRHHITNMKQYAVPRGWLQASAEWLEEHTPKNSIVFNTHWDNFSHLFFFNQHNYYIGGMDPIFQYSYNPRLYWEFHYLSSDKMGNVTCASYPCRDEDRRDTYEVLRNDFGASYVFVEKDRNPRFFEYLSSDARFENVFETSREIIFALLP